MMGCCVLPCIALIFVSDGFSEYKKEIRGLIQLLVNEDYNPQEVVNILSFYD